MEALVTTLEAADVVCSLEGADMLASLEALLEEEEMGGDEAERQRQHLNQQKRRYRRHRLGPRPKIHKLHAPIGARVGSPARAAARVAARVAARAAREARGLKGIYKDRNKVRRGGGKRLSRRKGHQSRLGDSSVSLEHKCELLAEMRFTTSTGRLLSLSGLPTYSDGRRAFMQEVQAPPNPRPRPRPRPHPRPRRAQWRRR